MVMKEVTEQLRPLRPRRLSVSEAKAKLSDAVRAAERAPVIIHSRGRDVAALIGIDEYERLQARPRGGRRFVEAIGDLKRDLGGAEFSPKQAEIRPADAFEAHRRSRGTGG